MGIENEYLDEQSCQKVHHTICAHIHICSQIQLYLNIYYPVPPMKMSTFIFINKNLLC